jgi:hypothetical protein
MMPIRLNTEPQHWLNSTDLGLPDGEGIFGRIVVCAVGGGVEVRHHSHLHLVLPRRREVVRETRLQRSDIK